MEKINNNNSKTIIFVLSSISDYNPLKFGGMQRYFFNVAKYLSKYYKVIIFSSFRYKYVKEKRINKSFKIFHIYFPSFDFIKLNYVNKIFSIFSSLVFYSFQVALKILLINKKIHSVIFVNKLESIIPSLICKLLKIKTIYFEGNEYPWNLYDYKPSLISWTYNIFIGKLSTKLVDLIIAQTLRIKKGMTKYIHKRIEVIPISIDTSFFKPLKKGNKNTIGYLGRLEKSKGMDLLLKILNSARKEYPEIKFIILGKGNYEKEIKSKKNVILLKEINVKEIPLYINKCIAFLSCQEAIGSAEAEILSCGKPLITLKSYSNSEIIKDFYNGVLCEKDPSDYLKKIKKILSDENLLNEMSKNARKTALEKFSIEVIGNKWKEILFK